MSLCGRSPPPPERERSPRQCVSERRVPLGVTVRSVFKNRCRQKRPSGRSEPVTARGPAPGSRSRVSPRSVGTAGTSPGAPCRRGFPGQGARTVGSQAPFPRVPVAQGPWALCVVPSCHMVPANPCETALPPERCCRAHPQLRPPGVKGQSSPSCPTCPPCPSAARMRGAVLILEVPSPLPSPSHVGSCVPWAVSGLLLPTCSVRAPVRPAPRVAAAAGG